MLDNQSLATLILGTAFIGTCSILDQIVSNKTNKREHFGTGASPTSPAVSGMFPTVPQFYNNKPYGSNGPFAGPDGAVPQNRVNINLNAAGDQLLDYQLYQQAVNAATPTRQQLDAISGNSQQQTGITASELKGGVSSDYAPYNVLSDNGPSIYTSEYQAVNLKNPRAESISACAQNAPNFVATSLLPKPTVPGQNSWDIGAPQNILASQNFLSATQQIGVDTVLSSNKNPSYDIRNSLPCPISTVSPWLNSSILPDLEKRPLDAFIAQQGLYGPGPGGDMQTGTYVGR